MSKFKRNNLTMFILITIGVLFLLYDPIKNWILTSGAESLEVNSISIKDIEKNSKESASFNYSDVEELDFETILKANLNKESISVIGGISIPSINLNLPIGKGTSNYTLALTAGTMKEDQKMGEGNYALAGHHMKNDDLLFSPLVRIEEGAVVFLTDLEYVYEYQIDEQRTIEANDIEVLDTIAGENILTLITCNEDGEARILTQGQFIKKVPVQDATDEMKKAFEMNLNNE